MSNIDRLYQMIEDVRSDNDRKALRGTLDMLCRPKFKITENKDYSIERDPFGFTPPEPGLFIAVQLQIGDRVYGETTYLSPYYLARENGTRYKEYLTDTLKSRVIRKIIEELTDGDD
jgi:hypothetical protein